MADVEMMELDNLAVMPDEILVAIFSFLDAKDLYSMSRTGKYWHTITEEDMLWKKLVYSSIPQTKVPVLIKKHDTPPNSPGKDSDRAMGTGRWKSLYAARIQTRNNWKKAQSTLTLLEAKRETPAFSLAVNDSWIASGGSDHNIVVYDSESGDYQRTLTGHQYAVWALNIPKNRDMLFSASYDSTIKYWDIESGTAIRTLTGHSSAIWALDSRGSKIASGSTDTHLRIWDMETGKCCNKILGKQDTIWACKFIDENLVVSGGSDIKIWDLRACPSIGATNNNASTINNPATRYGPAETFPGHEDAVRCLQADASYVVSGSYDSTAFIFDRVAGKKLYELKDHTDSITSLQFDRHGMLVTSSFDHTFVQWDMATGEKVVSWGHDRNDKRLPSDPSEQRRLSADVQEHGNKVYAIHFDEFRLVSCREDGRVAIHDFA